MYPEQVCKEVFRHPCLIQLDTFNAITFPACFLSNLEAHYISRKGRMKEMLVLFLSVFLLIYLSTRQVSVLGMASCPKPVATKMVVVLPEPLMHCWYHSELHARIGL